MSTNAKLNIILGLNVVLLVVLVTDNVVAYNEAQALSNNPITQMVNKIFGAIHL